MILSCWALQYGCLDTFNMKTIIILFHKNHEYFSTTNYIEQDVTMCRALRTFCKLLGVDVILKGTALYTGILQKDNFLDFLTSLPY